MDKERDIEPVTRGGDPSLEEVARAAGVSRATAARALGGYGSVSDDVRGRVAAASSRLGYRPNRRARSVTLGRTRTIGVVVGDIGLPFFAGAVRAIADTAQAAGWEVVLANTGEDPDRERAAVRVLDEERVDGLLIAPASSEHADHLEALARRGVPVVLFDRAVLGMDLDAVVTDNAAAMGRAVGLLARLGHRAIGLVGNVGLRRLPIPIDDPDASAEERARASALAAVKPVIARIAGYVQGLEAAGLPVRRELVRVAEINRDAAAVQALELLTGPEPVTSIVTTDSRVTLGVLDAVRHAQLRIPDEVSLIGFDDADWATVAVPSITVIEQPVARIGETATMRLLARIGGEPLPPERIIVPTRIIFRESTAPPPREEPTPLWPEVAPTAQR